MHERYDDTPYEGRVVTLLAGIRADGTALIAFPSPCSGVSVASDESGLKAKIFGLQSSVLPLRGQRRLKVMAMNSQVFPASR